MLVGIYGGFGPRRSVAVSTLKEGRLLLPSGAWCAGGQVIGPESQPAPHCRSRLVGGAWGVRASDAAAGLPPHLRSRSVGGAWGGRPPGRVGSLSALLPVSLPCRALGGAAKT